MQTKTKPVPPATFAVTRKVAVIAAKHMYWDQIGEQVSPICFQVMENGKFCGKTSAWHCYSYHHEFVSLADLIRGIV